MAPILVFAVTLIVAVLLSGLAHRSVLSTAVLFLITGFVAGHGLLGWIPLQMDDKLIGRFAELTLFSVLFVDGMRVNFHDLRHSWRLPARCSGSACR